MLEPAHDVIVGLLRRTWLVALATVVVCAVYAARAVASFAEAKYLSPAGHGTPPSARALDRPVHPPRPDGAELVERDMFCSTCTPAGGPGSPELFSPAAILIATTIGAEPRATLVVPASGVQGSFGVGDMLAGVGRIAAIGWVSVDIVDASGRHGRLSLLAAGAATPAAMPPADASPWADRLRATGEHDFDVERSLVRELVAGTVKPGGVRVLPVTDGGKLSGVRFGYVPAGSLPAALGLRAGDVLSEVNGTAIDSANAMFRLYEQIDQLTTVELDGSRGGKPLRLTFHLR